jgi:hypothetical protein
MPINHAVLSFKGSCIGLRSIEEIMKESKSDVSLYIIWNSKKDFQCSKVSMLILIKELTFNLYSVSQIRLILLTQYLGRPVATFDLKKKRLQFFHGLLSRFTAQ